MDDEVVGVPVKYVKYHRQRDTLNPAIRMGTNEQNPTRAELRRELLSVLSYLGQCALSMPSLRLRASVIASAARSNPEVWGAFSGLLRCARK